MTKKQLSRRTVLRGLGATVALPFLDAMYPAFAAQVVKQALRPTRMAFLYVPNGIVMEDWTPAGGLGVTPLLHQDITPHCLAVGSELTNPPGTGLKQLSVVALTAALGREPVAHEIEDAITWADQGQFEDS